MGMSLPLPVIRKQIASGIDIIVHLGRLRDKTRKVLQIVEVVGCEKDEVQFRVLYEFQEQGEENGKIVGRLQPVEELVKRQKLLAAGMEL